MIESFCDFLSFTVDFSKENLEDAFLFFGKKSREGKGIYGYSLSAWTNTDSVIAWNPEKPDRRLWISLSSDALANMKEFQKKDFYHILEWAEKRNAVVTRIDLAQDDFFQILNLDTIAQKIKEGHIASRLRTWREYIGHFQNSEINSHKIKNSKRIGRTIYLGDLRTGNVVFRFYDKSAEQGINGHWIRCELQLRNEASNQFCFPFHYEEKFDFQTGEKVNGKKSKKRIRKDEKLLTIKDRSIPGTFYYYLRFLEPTETKEKQFLETEEILGVNCYFPKYIEKKRWETSLFWLNFCGFAEPQKIGLPKYKGELEDLLAYWRNSMAGLNYLLTKKSKDKLEEILEKEGKEMFLKNPHYKRIMNNGN